jgi:hypothetical protein
MIIDERIMPERAVRCAVGSLGAAVADSVVTLAR